MIVATARLELRVPGCRSLKEKRHVIKALTAGIRSAFNASVAEVDHQDLWQRSTLGVAVASGDGGHARRTLAQIERFVERDGRAELLRTELGIHDPDD